MIMEPWRGMETFKKFLMAALLATSAAASHAETVYVKYQGNVDLAPYECEWTRSSLVHRLCYNSKMQHAVVLLGSTYYAYCGMPSNVVSAWRSAPSLGRFYNANVKGSYGCR